MVLVGGNKIKYLTYARHYCRCGRYPWKRQNPDAMELTFWCEKQETSNIVPSDECCEEKL